MEPGSEPGPAMEPGSETGSAMEIGPGDAFRAAFVESGGPIPRPEG
jgi:hypothetical protein